MSTNPTPMQNSLISVTADFAYWVSVATALHEVGLSFVSASP